MPDNFTIVFIAGTILVIFLCTSIIVFVILYTRNQLRFRAERQQFRQALLEAEVEIRNVTLNMIARDLHDNLGQIASLIKINLSLMESDLNPANRIRWQESRQLMSSLIEGIRNLTLELQAHELKERDLESLMVRDVERFNATGSFQTKLAMKGDNIHHLNADIALFLYRMFQEIMHNILKHAEANEVKISLDHTPEMIILGVKDDGKGFNADEAKGNGLNNIRERCRLINANVTIDSFPAKGTEICIKIPLPKNPSNGEK